MNRAVLSRVLRGRILKVLEIDYPRELSVDFVALTLSENGFPITPSLLEGHVAYLEEKGYLESRRVGVDEAGIERRVIRLTARGKDLLEGSIEPDPGVHCDGQKDRA